MYQILEIHNGYIPRRQILSLRNRALASPKGRQASRNDYLFVYASRRELPSRATLHAQLRAPLRGKVSQTTLRAILLSPYYSSEGFTLGPEYTSRLRSHLSPLRRHKSTPVARKPAPAAKLRVPYLALSTTTRSAETSQPYTTGFILGPEYYSSGFLASYYGFHTWPFVLLTRGFHTWP